MAVKQNNVDSGSSSGTTAHNGNQNNEKTSNLTQILEVIDLLNKNERKTGFTTDSDFIKVCECIVYNLSKVVLPRDKSELKKLREDINKIQEFLAKSIEGDITICLNYLRIVHNLIVGPETPSGAIAIVFQLFPEDWIGKAISLTLSNTERTTDENIQKAVKVLCYWLRTCLFCQNLYLWILAILNGLREQQKYDLLMNIALDVIEPLFNSLIIPLIRPKVAPVIFHLLSSIKDTPVVFHKIIVCAPKVIKQLKNESSTGNIDETKKILQNLVDILSALILQFPGYDHLYKETEELLTNLTPSYDFQIKFDFANWPNSATGQIIRSNAKVGLINLGNTCYMNSVLQALAMTKEFSREILLSTSTSPLLIKIQQLLALMLYSIRPELTPGLVLRATRPPGFIPGLQQDSSEFLGYLLEMLHEQENNYQKSDVITQELEYGISKVEDIDFGEGATAQHFKPNSNIIRQRFSNNVTTTIEKTFAGRIATIYKCLTCGWESRNIDTFRDLQLSFPEVKTDCASNYSVQDLLDYYCSPEKLYGENQYFCEQCKKLCDAQRFISVVKAPKNLILTLKHFKYDQKYHMRAKLMHKVYHDESVSLKICSDESSDDNSLVNYNLYAAVVHSGFSMDSGHYYTYATENSENWYKFNDNIVTTCSISELHNSHPPNTPYILFYRMISKSGENSLSVSKKVVKIEESNLPTLTELAPHLLDIVNRENFVYNEEIRLRRLNIPETGMNIASSKKKDDGNGDNDDEPPSACGSNALNYFNRYIC